MSKISSFKVEVPCDDPVKAEAVKAVLLEVVRGIGAKVMGADQVEGDTLTEPPTAFFSAASVKTFVVQGPRAKGKVKL